MKSLSVALSLLLASAPVFGQASAPAPVRIGAAAAVRGTIKATAPGQVGRIVSSGKPLFLNDRVVTDANGKMQVLLLDQTVFTLGPNSDMVLDEFVYDPGKGAGKLTMRIAKGAFRFVTGLIARQNPESMKVKLAVGTIGIRGTVVMGETGPEGSTVINVGAGTGNNANEPPSALYVENAGQTVDVEQSGQGTTVAAGQPPAPPTDMTGQINKLSDGLESSSSAGGDTGKVEDQGTPTQAAGQDTALGGAMADQTANVQTQGQAIDTGLNLASQDAEDLAIVENHGLTDGVALWEDLRDHLPTGAATYVANGNFYQTVMDGADISGTPVVGGWGYQVDVDFGTRLVSTSFGFDTTDSGGNINGFGVQGGLDYERLSGPSGWAVPDLSGNGVATFQFLNQNGEAAAAVLGHTSYADTNAGGNVATGDIIAAPKGPFTGGQ